MADFENKESEPQKKPLSGRKPDKVIRGTPSKKERKRKEKEGKVTVHRKRSSKEEDPLTDSFFELLYKNLYITGIFVIRWWKRFRKRLKFVLSKISGRVWSKLDQISNVLHRRFANFRRKVKAPFRKTKEVWNNEQEDIREAKADKKTPWKSYGRILKQVGSNLWLILRIILNYVLPIASAILLVLLIQNTTKQELGLHVTYKGQDIGYIKTEKEFVSALKDVNSRMTGGASSEYTSEPPLFQVVVIRSEDQLLSPEDLADGIIRASSDQIVPAYGLYVNGELLGAVTESTEVANELERIRTSSKIGKEKERVEFGKTIKFPPGLFPNESIVESEELIRILNSQESGEETYTIQEGDTPSGISDKLGVPLSSLEDLNPDYEANFLVGRELKVALAKPFLPVRNIYTDTYEEEIPFESVELENALYDKGYRKVEEEGVNGVAEVTAEFTLQDGIEVGHEVISTKVITKPVDEKIVIGVKVIAPPPKIPTPGTTGGGTGGTTPSVGGTPPPLNQSGFIFPTAHGYVGTPLWGYPGHSGMDIIGTGGYGAPVYASASGTVVKAQLSYLGYGNHIVIDHGNGYTTLYGHNSSLNVSVGQHVNQGDLIALVGSTGNSTGPHIHFEVRYNGQILNPANYVGTRR